MKKHIVCLGDSNTHGYCADPSDTEDGGVRYTENERWTCLLQKKLGEEYFVIEEGLSGRTTVFPDPLTESMDAVSVAFPILKSHEVVDLLVIMLGTNDTKDRFGADAACIGWGMRRLLRKCVSVNCWGEKDPKILIICPPPIGREMKEPTMGLTCAEKSEQLAPEYEAVARENGCYFLDAAGCEFNQIDYMHLTKKGHAELSERIFRKIKEIEI